MNQLALSGPTLSVILLEPGVGGEPGVTVMACVLLPAARVWAKSFYLLV